MNFPIGLSLADKIKLLREWEELSVRGLESKSGIPRSTISNMETGKTKTINTDIFNRFVEHDELAKYAFWLLKDDIDDKTIDEMLAFRGKGQETDEPTPDDQPD